VPKSSATSRPTLWSVTAPTGRGGAKVDRIRRALGDIRGPTLDVGGNTAGESTILEQAGYTMVVGDLNESALTISRARNRSFGLLEPKYVGLDANRLPFVDGSFDAVVMVEALQHLANYTRPLLEVFRVLRTGGLFFTIEPNARDPIRRAAEVRDRFRGTIEKSLSMRQLKQLCQEAGFVTVRIGSVTRNPRGSWKRSRNTDRECRSSTGNSPGEFPDTSDR
jgi:ubiquinone/menaquinone biosynthesis C-methylase UbiE